MSELNKHAEYAHYDSLSTEDLQEILRKHAHGELQTEPDTDELYYIMEVLAERRQQTDPTAFHSDEESLADLRKHYMPKEESRVHPKVVRLPNRILRTVAAVAAAVLIGVVGTSITADAFQIDIWGKFANWTKEIFQFTGTPQGTAAANPEKGYNAELKSLQDALNDHEVIKKLAPTWMPEGYKSKDLQIMITPRVLNINAIYENNGLELVINIRQTIGISAHQIEKNDDLLEVYAVDSVEYYIFSNTETLQSAWSIGEFECQIIGKISIEEMKEMINSIQ